MQQMIPIFILSILTMMFCVILAMFFYVPFPLWIKARFCGIQIGIMQLLGMKIRKVNPNVIVENAILLHKAGINIPLDQLEAQYLAGGNLNNVANALIEAKKADIKNINYKLLTAIDLAGNNPVDTIKDIIIPKESESGDFICKTKDGKQYKVSFKTTSQLSREKPRALGSDCIIFDIKKYIEDYIYNLDSSKDVDAIALRNDILGTDFETGHGFIVHDIKVYTQRA